MDTGGGREGGESEAPALRRKVEDLQSHHAQIVGALSAEVERLQSVSHSLMLQLVRQGMMPEVPTDQAAVERLHAEVVAALRRGEAQLPDLASEGGTPEASASSLAAAASAQAHARQPSPPRAARPAPQQAAAAAAAPLQPAAAQPRPGLSPGPSPGLRARDADAEAGAPSPPERGRSGSLPPIPRELPPGPGPSPGLGPAAAAEPGPSPDPGPDPPAVRSPRQRLAATHSGLAAAAAQRPPALAPALAPAQPGQGGGSAGPTAQAAAALASPCASPGSSASASPLGELERRQGGGSPQSPDGPQALQLLGALGPRASVLPESCARKGYGSHSVLRRPRNLLPLHTTQRSVIGGFGVRTSRRDNSGKAKPQPEQPQWAELDLHE